MSEIFTWSMTEGYEVSSKGDKRFSAFNAILEDGRSIEQIYQCSVKGYDPGGTDWRLGKGKPPLDPSVDLWEEYLALWYQWARSNIPAMRELYTAAKTADYKLRDRFATTPINQARALAHILTDWSNT